ncbi:hypothetical protein ACFYZE_05480 [Streptomyces sp. NPDC001796]|uniref:hypothetical protein n=1 Tax=Streptomyces sp. NPDC001796 TaxID=3364609 RepID=UPI00368D0F10
MSEETHDRLSTYAAAERKTPDESLQEAIAEALARAAPRRAQLECSLNELLRLQTHPYAGVGRCGEVG